ncbi:MAG: hypothetical protein ACKVTZ_11440 [Bacteroidia bacterium]
MKKFIYTIGLASFLFLLGCSEAQESFTFEVKGKDFSIEQPTPGPNSAQVEISFEDIKAAAEAKGLDASKISAAKLEKAEVVAKDGQNLNGFESVLLQMTTETGKMSEVALLNPVPSGSSNATLEIAKNETMATYFKGEKVTLILDLNSPAGDSLKHDMSLNATFQLSAAKK